MNLYFLLILLLLSVRGFGEGTKEMTPTSTANNVDLQINRSSTGGFASTFAGWTATTTEDRLYIHINDYSTEKIYLGFQKKTSSQNVYYRIKRPDGTVVLGPTAIPTSGNGYISTWNQASIGPSTLTGNSGGYSPTVFDLSASSSTAYNGDYYIEFNTSSSTANTTEIFLKYYDITVANGSSNTNVKTGRLWSYYWGFNSNGFTPPNTCVGSLFIYASDSIVTEVDLNGLSPFYFRIFANSTGVTNTGNMSYDRQSKDFGSGDPMERPEFKVFLNDPDLTAYPSATLANRSATFNSFTGCPGNYCFNFTLNGAALTELKLDLNNNGSYSDAIDRTLESNGTAGANCIPWDGKDGNGNNVANNTTFKLNLYTKVGTLHIPVYDAEQHTNGYLAQTVRPTGIGTMTVYWDDDGLSGGSMNLSGVTATAPVSGGSTVSGHHTWMDPYGNQRVMNTWFTVKKTVMTDYSISLASFSGSISAQTNVNCFGQSTGSATAAGSQGTLPYTYSWNTSPVQTTATATGLAAGTYTCTITDFRGCVTTVNATITQPIAALASTLVSQTNVLCYGNSTGAININVTGGTGAYSYVWTKNGGAFAPTTQDLTGLGAGVYAVTITDANNCTTTRSVTITEPIAALTSSLVSQTNVSCFGGSNGEIDINVTGGTSPYAYVWTKNAGAFAPTTQDLTGLGTGVYAVTITDAHNCTTTRSVTITEPSAALSAACSNISPTGFGTNDGSVSVVATGGTPTYGYLWSNSATTATVNGLATGTFSVVVTDANGCTATCNTTLNSFPNAVNDITSTNEDTPVNGNAQTNDNTSGDGGNVWTLVGVNGGASHGTVTMNPNGSYTYTPDANYNGTDVFTYQLCDIDNDCSTATVTITINSVNDVPVAVNDVNTTNEDTPVNGTAQTNDTPSGDGGNVWTLVGVNGGAAHGTVTMNTDGSYTYTPDANYNGTDVFNYQVCDVTPDCSTATVTITINSVNDVPVAVNDVNTTNEDTPVNGTAQTNDTPSGDGGNVWTLVGVNGGAAHGTVIMNTDGSYTYTPDANYNGTDVFTYQVCDVTPDCSTATVTITINSVNDVPVAVNDVNTTNEDTPVNGTAQTNDTPSGDGGNVWTLVGVNGGAAHGTVTMNTDGSYTYTPDANYNGTDVFTYQVCDAITPIQDCSTATVTITINSVNDVPVAVNDVNTTNEDTPVNGTAQTNDTPSGDGGNVWTLVGVNGGAAHGTVTMNTDGSYTYTPDANYNGTDVFTYQVCDAITPIQDCSTATVTITIDPINDVPVAVNDVNTTNEDTPVNGTAQTNDTPSGDGGNVWTLVGVNGGAAHGTVTMNPDGSYTYTPDANYNGTDVFTYQVCDVTPDCSTATVTITINSVNDVPVAVNDLNTTNEDTPVNGTAQTNDTPSGDGGNVWTLVGVNGGAAHGTVTMNTDGSYTYTPDANYNGTDVFTYQVCDVTPDCSTATVTITINSVNDVPVAVNDVNTTNEDTPVNGTAQTNDTPSGDGGNVWTLVGVNGGAAHGTVTMNPDGSYTYTPDANYNGTDVFTYQVCDVTPDCSTATVTITIDPINDVPVAVNDVNTTTEDTPVNGTAQTNDTPSGDGGNVWTLVGVNGGAAHGNVTMNPDGSYTYTPDANYNGTDVFTYQVCDVTPDCSTATVTITINSVNDVPVAVNDVNTTNEDTPVNGTAQTNDTPSGDGGNVWTLVGVNGGAAHGTVSMNPDGSYTYTPDANYNGTDVFTYQVCDVTPDCSTATVTITIDPINDVPVAVNDVNTTNEDTPVNGTAQTNDTPSGDGGNVWTLVGVNGGAAHGTVTMNTDGSYTYTPDANYNGTDVFTYQVCDAITPIQDCSTATVTITIDPINDVPVAVNDVNTTNEDTPVNGTAQTNDTPSGDGGNVWSLVGVDGGATHGTVSMNPDGSYTYTPDANYNGTDVFTYQVCDAITPIQDCSTATVTITINSVNDVPVAVNDVNTTNEDTPVNGTAQTNDTPSGDGGNVWTLVGVNGGAAHGTVTMNTDGSYTYTPDANYNGTDVFTYQVCDVTPDCSTATVTITINSVNDVPVAVNDVNTTNEDTPVNGTAQTNDTPSGDGGNVWSLVGVNGGAAHGTVTMNTDGSYTYTPDANYNGTDVFTYQVCDVTPDCSTATVTITINSVNDVPVAVNDVNTTNEDTPVNGTAQTNDTPSGDGGNVWSLVGVNGGAAHGTVTMNTDGSYTYTPDANYTGTDVFTYQVCDVTPDCSTATVTITIDPINDVP
ncbi:MAG: tandem-95 repeat protein, partial [Bacteroidia bacterium]|nr:tandem-95 repeat protein [Bacteroidia bacterium]